MDNLRQTSTKHIEEHFGELGAAELTKLPCQVLKNLLSSENLNVDDEMKVFKGVTLWIEANPNQGEKEELLKPIIYEFIKEENRAEVQAFFDKYPEFKAIATEAMQKCSSSMYSKIERTFKLIQYK
ncbi:hypothetical protein Ciccas_012403 [Cichlidogyrus casuarinus]|uniref:BACK domain-containing protein n=1 Tax=Cichlidogyrus casuarinus TaxID=1844966 RepID=A0ABD2PP77_9PLAT